MLLSLFPTQKQIWSWIKLAISSNGQKLLRTYNWCCIQPGNMFNRAIYSYQPWFPCSFSLHIGAWYIWTAHSLASILHRLLPRLQGKSNFALYQTLKTHSCLLKCFKRILFFSIALQRFYTQKRAHFHLNYLLGAIISVFLFFGFYFHIFWTTSIYIRHRGGDNLVTCWHKKLSSLAEKRTNVK